MDRIQTYIQVLQGMPVPTLKKRSDIWNYFPVNSKPLGRGNNRAERHGIEWHMTNLRKMSEITKQSIQVLQKTLTSLLLKALGASPYWRLEESTNMAYIAKIAMRFDVGTNNTRKNHKNSNSAPPVVQYRTWSVAPPVEAAAEIAQTRRSPRNSRNTVNATRRKTPSPKFKILPNKPKTQAEINENAFFARLAAQTSEEKAANNLKRKEQMKKYMKTEPEHIKQIRQIVNKLTKDNQEKLTHELVTTIPTSSPAFQESIAVFVDLALNTQAYHPLLIQAVHQMNANPAFPVRVSEVLSESFMTQFRRAFSNPTFLVPQTQQQVLNYRCYLLFAGYMYRERFLSWSHFKEVLGRLEEFSADEDNPNIQNEAILGLQYALIRGGKRMQEEGESAETFTRLMDYLGDLSKYYGVSRIRIQIQNFLEAVQGGFLIRASDPWAVGAPGANVKPVGPVAIVAAPEKPKAKGLGKDIAELWKRYPLDVKSDGRAWLVKFHNKKLAERFEKEKHRFKTVAHMQQEFQKEIQSLVEYSDFWKMGPIIPGTILTVVPK